MNRKEIKKEYLVFLEEAKKDKDLNKALVKSWKKRTPKKLDEMVHSEHEEAFDKIDCLDCGNCCKTTSPVFTDKDINRISKHLRIKPTDFFNTYLKIDEDNDQVLKKSPCAFLQDDNSCQVYDVRPKACREYPHTDRKKFHQILDLSLENTVICPAVAEIFKSIRE